MHLLYPGGTSSLSAASLPIKRLGNKSVTHYQAEVANIKLLLNLSENVRIQGFTKPHNVGTEKSIAAILLTPVQKPQSNSVTLLRRPF